MNDPWPHTDKDVCAHLWVITNLNKEQNQVCEFFTNAASMGIAASVTTLAAVMTALF